MPKIVDHDQYREELVDKCFKLFSEKGFSNVTMREIAAETGISTGALYHYFPTKQSILEYMFQVFSKRDVEEAVRRTSVSGSFEQRLKLFFDFFLEREANFQNMLLLSIDFLRNYNSDDSERVVYQWMDYYLKSMQQYLGLPESIALTVMIFFNGLVYQTKLFPKFMSSAEQLAVFRDILLNYLKDHQDTQNRLCRVCPFVAQGDGKPIVP